MGGALGWVAPAESTLSSTLQHGVSSVLKAAVAYLRVSTSKQETDSQRAEIAAAAEVRGYTVECWYDETVTGRTLNRPALKQLREDVRSRRVRTVFVFALDRLSRAGILDSLVLLRELEGYGAEVISLKDPIPEPGAPHRDLVLSVLFWVAEMESKRRSERTRAGLAAAKQKGKRLGRKPREVDFERVIDLREKGRSWRSIARALRVSKSVLLRRARRAGALPSRPPPD